MVYTLSHVGRRSCSRVTKVFGGSGGLENVGKESVASANQQCDSHTARPVIGWSTSRGLEPLTVFRRGQSVVTAFIRSASCHRPSSALSWRVNYREKAVSEADISVPSRPALLCDYVVELGTGSWRFSRGCARLYHSHSQTDAHERHRSV